jgi:hypothetical protein
MKKRGVTNSIVGIALFMSGGKKAEEEEESGNSTNSGFTNRRTGVEERAKAKQKTKQRTSSRVAALFFLHLSVHDGTTKVVACF